MPNSAIFGGADNRFRNREDNLRHVRPQYPKIERIIIPRAISERIDLTLTAKLSYGVLYGEGKRTWRAFSADTIAGIIGVSTYHVQTSLKVLADKGLILRRAAYRTVNGHISRLPTRYFCTPVPERFSKEEKKYMLEQADFNLVKAMPLKSFDNEVERYYKTWKGPQKNAAKAKRKTK